MTALRLRAGSISHTFKRRNGTEVRVLDNVSLHARSGEIVCIVGPSGIGKSTLLRALAGRPANGSLHGGGNFEKHGRVAWQPQQTALVRARSVLQNIKIGALAQGINDPTSVAMELLELVQLSGWGPAYPTSLSVGMQQRVALARTLAAKPQLALLDEPLSALDMASRIHISSALREYVSDNHAAIVMVTHTIEEAIDFGSRVYVLTGSPGTVSLVCGRSADKMPPRDENIKARLKSSPSKGVLFDAISKEFGVHQP